MLDASHARTNFCDFNYAKVDFSRALASSEPRIKLPALFASNVANINPYELARDLAAAHRR